MTRTWRGDRILFIVKNDLIKHKVGHWETRSLLWAPFWQSVFLLLEPETLATKVVFKAQGSVWAGSSTPHRPRAGREAVLPPAGSPLTL